MTNDSSDTWSIYKEYTRQLSENSRKLAFAGIAACWVIKGSAQVLTDYLFLSLLFFVVFFLFDVLHYFIGAVTIKVWVRGKEIEYFNRNGSIDGEYQRPGWLDWPAFFFLTAKVAVLAIGFIFLVVEILSELT